MEIFLTLLAVVPSVAWLFWIWRCDKYQREPLRLVLLLLMVGGIISVVGTLMTVSLYAPLVPGEEEAPIINMLFTAALPEELWKMLPVLLFARGSKQWDEPFDGIVYAGATALGFNLIETVLYMEGEQNVLGSIFQGLVRGTLGGHMVYGIIMGFFLSRARFTRDRGRWANLGLALGVPMALHTAWNAALTYGGEIIEGHPFAGMFSWGLATALWLLAFSYIRQARDPVAWHPQSPSVPAAPTRCWQCGSAYPLEARHCQGCGARVRAQGRKSGGARDES